MSLNKLFFDLKLDFLLGSINGLDSTLLDATRLNSFQLNSTRQFGSARFNSTQLDSPRLNPNQLYSIPYILFCSTLLYLWLAKSGHLALAPRFANVANDVTDQQGRMTGSEQKHPHLSNLLLQLLLQKGHDLD